MEGGDAGMRFPAYIREFVAAWRDYRADPNTLIGQRYLIQDVIGEGSYGITYLALDQLEHRPVVLKQARPSKGALSGQLLEQEARILQSLNHPRLPVFKEWITNKRHSFLVMSLVEGSTLEDLIFEQGQRFGEADSAQITLQLLELIGYIHQQGFVHLDLRMPNILLQEGQLSLIDFGLARAMGEPPLSLLEVKSFRGSIGSSPYVTRLQSPAEPQSDLVDVGHFMLFLLYSAFESSRSATNAKDLSWQEELPLSHSLIEIIERLLQLRQPFADALEAAKAMRVFLSQAAERPFSFMSNNEYNRM